MFKLAMNRVETMMILMIICAEISMVCSFRFCMPRCLAFGSSKNKTDNTSQYVPPQSFVPRNLQPVRPVVFQIPNQRQTDGRRPNQRLVEHPDFRTELAKEGNIAVCAYKSMKLYMEDRYDMKRNVGKNDVSLFALYDGHGGEFVAEYASKHLLNIISKTILEKESRNIDYEDILKTQIMEFDKKLRTEYESEAMKSGSTALIGLIDPMKKMLYVANLGDTHGEMCCDSNGEAVPLSVDHDPKRPDEKERIEKAGGSINDEGYVNGLVNFTRSLGDFDTKHGEHPVISSEPEIKSFLLSITTEIKPQFIIFATDGGWLRNNDEIQSYKTKESIDVIKENYQQDFFGTSELVAYVEGERNGTDNNTIMVVKLEEIVGNVG